MTALVASYREFMDPYDRSGFGGCTISLVESSHVEDFVNQVARICKPDWFNAGRICLPAEEGAKEVPLFERTVT